ncbi:hypothetical protein D3C86_1472000 [compost metagenome]
MGRLGEAHGDTRTDGGGKTDEKGLPRILCRKGGRKYWCERRDGAIHQSRKTRLHIGQKKLPLCGFRLFGLAIFIEMFFFQHLRDLFVTPLRLGQIAEQLARIGVAGALDGLIVKTDRLCFHQFGLGTDFLERQVLHEPVWCALVKTAYMFSADQRDRLSETATMHVDQDISMLLLDLRHIVEDFGRLRILRAQVIGIGTIDAGIVFFGRNGECEDFLFAERGKGAFGQGKKTAKHG